MHEIILDFIRRYVEEWGYGPSHRDIQFGCGISSTSMVSKYLDELEASDDITRTPGVARSIRIKGEQA